MLDPHHARLLLADAPFPMNIFLLRWNPAVSSWKDADFRDALAKSREGPVAMDWSVREWEKLEEWDWAVLCRVGKVKGPVPITPSVRLRRPPLILFAKTIKAPAGRGGGGWRSALRSGRALC